MECGECEELTREMILKQFKNRELYVENAANLPLEKLREIYRAFMLPQPQRQRSQRSQRSQCQQQSETEIPMEVEKLMKRIKVVYVVGEKRPGDSHGQISEGDGVSIAKRWRTQE